MPQIKNNTIEFKLKALHPAQEIIAKSPARHKRVRAGRRFGKSIYCCSWAMLRALEDKNPVWWVAPTFNNTLAAWKELTEMARQLKQYAKIFKSELLIELPGGGSVKVVSAAEPDNMRSAGLGGVILDEAAYMEDRVYQEVLLPALADYATSWSVMISTPRGYNWFYDEWILGDKDNPMRNDDYESFHFTTYDNPHLNRDVLKSITGRMTQRAYQQEIMAEFVAEALSVFRGVKECVYYDTVHEPIPGHNYVMGVDWGRKSDYTAISVWDTEERKEVELDRFTDISFGIQMGRVHALAHKWNVNMIHAEQNSMGWANIEDMMKRGLPVTPFQMQAPSKKKLVENFALAVEQGTVRLIDHEAANDELMMYEEEMTASGTIKYHAPKGRHDDTVVARMLAYDLIETSIGDPFVLSWG